MIVGASHYMFFLQQYVCYYILDPLQRLATTIDDDDHKTNTTTPQSEQAETLRVVGIGFGRTGTVRSRNKKHIWTSLDRESARAFSLDSIWLGARPSFHRRFFFSSVTNILQCSIPPYGTCRQPLLKFLSILFFLLSIATLLIYQYSLTLALEELGIPTLHTQHLYENEAIFRMWSEDIFEPSVEKCHAELGKNVAAGRCHFLIYRLTLHG